jgi:hypothetical protein
MLQVNIFVVYPFVKPSVLTDVLLTAVAACYAYATSLFGRQFTHWKENML